MSERARDAVASLGSVLPAVFDSMFEGVQIVDRQWRYVYANAAAAAHGHTSVEELVGRTMMDAYPGIETTEMFGLLERCMAERTARQMVNRFVYPDGHASWFDLRVSPVPMGLLVLSVDVSEQKVIEEDLRGSREDLRTALNCMGEGVVTTDVEGCVTGMNPAAEELMGWSETEAMGRRLDDLVRFVSQRTGAAVEHPVERVLREGATVGFANGTVLVGRDGKRTPVASSGAPLRHPDGAVHGIVLALKDMRQEHELSSMLHQAQKMEAVGRLAGGVAHDFNNVLTVISGCAEILAEELPEGDDLGNDVQQILAASRRAAALTQQLLAFSRRRPTEPEMLHAETVLSGMENMLRRLIGEDIDLVVRCDPGLHPIRFDPGQLEQMVMNLAVNARDAMPTGGKLTIEASDVELTEEYARLHVEARAGSYVLIAVTDTGHGMDDATRERIFEPFFTTKPRGQGTGLGLATLYGAVKQADGNVWVYSEPDRGTTFKIYLPHATESKRALHAAAPASKAQAAASETVLVVEDDPSIRELIGMVLERAGYQVLQAAGPDDALELCERHTGPIHVLLTDVVLHEKGGPELAAEAVTLRPDLRVAYMSGYTDDALEHQGIVEPGVVFIEKPITPGALLGRLREVLAEGAEERSSTPRRAAP